VLHCGVVIDDKDAFGAFSHHDNLPVFELQTFSCHPCGDELIGVVDENEESPKSQ